MEEWINCGVFPAEDMAVEDMDAGGGLRQPAGKVKEYSSKK
jgi:hypothetical protein